MCTYCLLWLPFHDERLPCMVAPPIMGPVSNSHNYLGAAMKY